jgi:succinate dehydrogenase / fumarate reductase cytochrome b subunit
MKARGNQTYAVTKTQKGVEWTSQNMFVLGVIVFGFMILHLIQFWSKMQWVELSHKMGLETAGYLSLATNGAYWVKHYFENPLYSVLYIIWLVALWLHLTHGVWSALQTIGASNNVWLPRIKVISNIISTLIILMFISIPVYFLLGFSI